MTDTPTPRPHDPALPDAPASDAACAAGKEAVDRKFLLLVIVTLTGGILAIAMPLAASFTAALMAGRVLIGCGRVRIMAPRGLHRAAP